MVVREPGELTGSGLGIDRHPNQDKTTPVFNDIIPGNNNRRFI